MSYSIMTRKKRARGPKFPSLEAMLKEIFIYGGLLLIWWEKNKPEIGPGRFEQGLPAIVIGISTLLVIGALALAAML